MGRRHQRAQRGAAVRRFGFACGLLVLTALAGGCGDDRAPEARLEDAGERLSDAREDARDARGDLQEARARLAAAEAELREARKAVRAAERRVLSARELVERRATDVALFREIQARLLAAEALRHEAVAVRVEDGVVTLEGSVSDDAAREAALGLAGSTPGTAGLRDHLEVDGESDGSPAG